MCHAFLTAGPWDAHTGHQLHQVNGSAAIAAQVVPTFSSHFFFSPHTHRQTLPGPHPPLDPPQLPVWDPKQGTAGPGLDDRVRGTSPGAKKKSESPGIGPFAESATPTFLTGHGRGRRSGTVRVRLHGTQKSSERRGFTFRGFRCFLGGTRAKKNPHRSLRSRASHTTFHLATWISRFHGQLGQV